MTGHTLYISDLDGTLLGADSKVSSESAAILSRLIGQGVMFTVATARTPATVEPLLRDVAVTLPAIVLTGAAEWDLRSHRFTRIDYLSSDVARSIAECFERGGVEPFIYAASSDCHLDVYHASPQLSIVESKFVSERDHLRYKTMHIGVEPPATVVDCRSIMFLGIGDAPKIAGVAAMLEREGLCSISHYLDIFNPRVAYLEVLARGVSKASAVKRMSQRLGVDATVVFGDNLNDLPMMAVATRAVAVENACGRVRRYASEVIGPNTEDSVARYIALKQHSEHFEAL